MKMTHCMNCDHIRTYHAPDDGSCAQSLAYPTLTQIIFQNVICTCKKFIPGDY